MRLQPIQPDGTLMDRALAVPEAAREAIGTFVGLYARAFVPPWIGYVAVEHGVPVGTCAFKSPPHDGSVEIAYFTFPEHEGRGVATRMAQQLLTRAHATDPRVQVTAQTLPEENASTRILRKLNFVHVRNVQHPEDGLVWEWEPRPESPANHADQRE
ncbi:MAG: N-acetyltransferase [Opitutus sp.]|nr:N-acetyltransferase [Opitutus sp.]